MDNQSSLDQGFLFIGEYLHTMDSKGRVAVPAKFRGVLKGGVVVTKGLDRCLFVYPTAEWQRLANRLAALPFAQGNTRAFARLVLAGAMESAVDRQGRIGIPDYLRAYGGLKKKVVLIGLGSRLELWDAEAWDEYRRGTERNGAAIAEALNDLGV